MTTALLISITVPNGRELTPELIGLLQDAVPCTDLEAITLSAKHLADIGGSKAARTLEITDNGVSFNVNLKHGLFTKFHFRETQT